MITSSVSFQEALQSAPHLSDYIQGDDHNLATQLCRQHFQPNDFLLTTISLQLSDSSAKSSRVHIKITFLHKTNILRCIRLMFSFIKSLTFQRNYNLCHRTFTKDFPWTSSIYSLTIYCHPRSVDLKIFMI